MLLPELPKELLHGSSRKLTTLKSKQPTASPHFHRLEKYLFSNPYMCLTPYPEVAMFFAAKRSGAASMMGFQKGIAYLGKPELFDPDRDVYIYVVDSSAIPIEKCEWHSVFELRVRMPEIKFARMEVHKAGEIFGHFEVFGSQEEFFIRKSS